VAVTALALASTIMLGTIAMSVYECAMLQATLDEVGGTKYIVGNWAMHYYPFLRISLSGTVDYRTAGAVRQHLAAIAIIVVRVHFFLACAFFRRV
jgi:NO-binding membrane sensor protein with MHYT domain